MIRREAVKSIVYSLSIRDIVVSANGFVSRDLFEVKDRHANFYMIGSMGLASSIGLGLALKNPNKRVYIFDGDGNILMNLGSLVTIGSLRPKNLIHIVFDNNSHESTGGQPTNSSHVKIDMISRATNYKVFKVNSQNKLKSLLKNTKKYSGPLLILIKIERSKYVSKRINIEPTLIKSRFVKAINN